MGAIWSLIKVLPEIIALLKAVQQGIDELNTERKVKDDLKAIKDAVASKDATKLNAIFNDVPPPTP